MKNLASIIAAIYFVTIILIGAVAYGEIAKRATNNNLAFSIANGNIYLSDFLYFHTTGKMAISADRSMVYDADAIWRNLPESAKNQMSKSDLILIAMPYFIVIMSLWSFLDVHQAMICWLMFSFIALVTAILLILKNLRTPPGSALSVLGFSTAILASQPAWLNTFIGHACFFQFLFLSLFFYLFKKEKPLYAAFVLALASYKPQFVLPLLVAIAAHKKHKLILAFIFFVLSFVVLSGVILGFDTVLKVPGIIASWESEHAHFSAHMISLLSLLEAIIPHKIAYYLTLFIYFTFLIFTYQLWRKTITNSDSFRYAASTAVLSGLVLSPHAQSYDSVLLGITVCLLMPVDGFAGLKQNFCKKEKTLFGLFIIYPVLSWIYFLLEAKIPQISGYPLAITHLVMLVLITLLWRQKTEKQN